MMDFLNVLPILLYDGIFDKRWYCVNEDKFCNDESAEKFPGK